MTKTGSGGNPSPPPPDVVSIAEEIYKKGVGDLSEFTLYGNTRLRDKLQKAWDYYNRADEFDKPVAKKRVDDVRAEIEAERTEIAQKTFFGVFTFSTYNVKVYGDESSFTLIIPTQFISKADEFSSLDEINVFFPASMSDVTGDVTKGHYLIELSVSGKTNSIRELVRNSNNYRAKVWFKNIRSNRKVEDIPVPFYMLHDSYADVLKIEIIDIRQNTPPSRSTQRRR